MPFSGPGGVGEARVRLEQADDKHFELLEGFRYTRPSGRVFDVAPERLGQTDLTSVPAGFRWFVNAYGRHTLPALLHDCLIHRPAFSRAEADDIFLEALAAQRVPRIRRYLMWASVTFVTRFLHSGWRKRIGMLVWTLAAMAGTRLVYLSLSWPEWGQMGTTDWRQLAMGTLGPLPFAALWGRSWFAGICFGYGIVFLLPATVVVHVSFALYWLVEKGLEMTGWSSPPPDIDKF